MNADGLQAANSIDLEPWLIVQGTPPDTSIASWRIEQDGAAAVAFFSSEERAADYAQLNCPQPHSLVQFDQHALIRLLADCFRQGSRYAALDPTASQARQLFVLRDVLTAARSMLQNSRTGFGST